MATSISARLARAGKKDTAYTFNSSSTALVSKLRQEGQLNSVENVMLSIDQVSTLLQSGIAGHYTDNILNMCQHLKVYGACLEVIYKDQLDRAFVVFRNSSQDEEKLDYQSRLHLLELIELRANQWKGTDVMSQYYKKKINHEIEISTNDIIPNLESSVLLSPVSPPLLGPGEIMKSSGKFPKPTRIPGKNYCKDEVVIRNADSGKVMGIKGRRVHMIEELSETIISFQRVNPGAKERLVQITGATESSICHAKQLIEDTIRRNASPIRDPNINMGALAGSSSSLNSSGSDDSVPPMMMTHGNLIHSLSTNDANVGEYKYTVTVNGTDTIKITGYNLDLVRLGKIVLDEYFNGRAINGVNEFYTIDTVVRSPISPIETNENEPKNLFSNGQTEDPTTPIIEDEFKPIRKPHLKLDNPTIKAPETDYKPRKPNLKLDISATKTTETGQSSSPEKVKRQYSHECLVRMSMSPKAICVPDDWDRITYEHPAIVRKAVEIFDADQYLANRATMVHALCTSASDDSILSGSSI